MVLEKTLETPLDSKEIKLVHLKENQFWILIGRTDAEAETPIFWPPDVKNWLSGKDPCAGKDWRQEEKGTTEDEIVGLHHSSIDMSLSKLWEIVKDGKPGVLQSVGSLGIGHDLATEQQQGLMSAEGFPLGLHMATSCVLTRPRLFPSARACTWRERELKSSVVSLVIMTLILMAQGPTLWPHWIQSLP